jgi:UDP-N-acetylmuramoyl-tripeptide--D-alanyl-D-alanine ligase
MATPIPGNSATFTLEELARATGGALRGAAAGASICGVVIDSRAVRPGTLFVALRGERLDGHAYLTAAAAQGAAALLVERGRATPADVALLEVDDTLVALGAIAALHRRRWARPVVGVCGSAGKTTTKELTAAALTGAGLRVHKTAGNLNNLVGAPMTLLELGDEHEAAVIELGTSAPGEVARLAAIAAPDVAIVTLASAEHLEGLGTLEAVAEEETAVWRALGPSGRAIGNADDPPTLARLPAGPGSASLSFGKAPGASVQLLGRALDRSSGSRATYRIGERTLEVALPLLGEVAALDAGAALCAVLALRGADALDGAARGLSEARPAAGRLVPVPGVLGTLVIDDTYNANPHSVLAALDTVVELARLGGARAIAVLGDMKELGPDSHRYHEQVGKHAVKLGVSVLVGCGREMVAATAAAAWEASGRFATFPTQVMHVADPLDAIPVALSLLRAGDVVLVKGSRSMAMERIVEALAGAPLAVVTHAPHGGAA